MKQNHNPRPLEETRRYWPIMTAYERFEQIVAFLLDEDMLGGFHFNDRKYADDDLTMGSIDPYAALDWPARLEPGQRSAWPHARLRGGGTVDLREVPGTESDSHDDVYLTDLVDGLVVVEGHRLRFSLRFDHTLFRWLISWQPYGGARAEPLAGSYALGIEPWVSRLPLGEAVAAGEAVELAPGASLETTLTVDVEER